MRFSKRIQKELLRALPIFLFFFIFFTAINSTLLYLDKKAGLSPFHLAEILIAAGLITKILLLVDHLFFIDFFKKHPLIYGIIWKTLIYSASLFLVRILIRFFPFIIDGHLSFKAAYQEFLTLVDWGLFFSIQIYYLMFLFIFVTFREITFKIGVSKMKKLFFEADHPNRTK